MESFLDSDGGNVAREALLVGEIWRARGQAQYGATSEAMLGLLDDVRRLKRGGRPVDVVLFNRRGDSSQDREHRMAEALGASVEASADDLFVVLTGNIHSRVRVGTPWDAEFEPMGHLLTRRHPDWRVLSLDVAHSGGTAWLCVMGEACGPRRQRARGEEAGEPFTVTFGDEVLANGHHGYYFVGPIAVSPPAVPDPDPDPDSASTH